MLALAFGNHDIVTEFLNEEIETAGQVALEPWPTIKMDGTQVDSIRHAFACGDIALDTLAAAAHVLLLVPGDRGQVFFHFGDNYFSRLDGFGDCRGRSRIHSR